MQKIWSKKSKQSQPMLPQDNQSELLTPDEAAPAGNAEMSEDISEDNEDNSEATEASAKTLLDWETSFIWLFLSLAIGGVALVAFLGLQYLTTPEANPDSSIDCRSKISGDWTTPFGKVTLKEEDPNRVLGKYTYGNFERGKVVGEIMGKLSNNNVVEFDWKETSEQQSPQNGKGILVFIGGCQQFYGSYGTDDSIDNFGNWQGSRLSK
jgi:hypothetical protein